MTYVSRKSLIAGLRKTLITGGPVDRDLMRRILTQMDDDSKVIEEKDRQIVRLNMRLTDRNLRSEATAASSMGHTRQRSN